jgi:hypothetical protein
VAVFNGWWLLLQVLERPMSRTAFTMTFRCPFASVRRRSSRCHCSEASELFHPHSASRVLCLPSRGGATRPGISLSSRPAAPRAGPVDLIGYLTSAGLLLCGLWLLSSPLVRIEPTRRRNRRSQGFDELKAPNMHCTEVATHPSFSPCLLPVRIPL